MRFLLVHDSIRTAENLKGFFQEMYELFVKVGHVCVSAIFYLWFPSFVSHMVVSHTVLHPHPCRPC